MPKGDGQGGNNGKGEERGPRSADELLLRRIATHEQNIKDGFDPLFQAEMIARCHEQLAKLKESPWPLEAMERCDPLKMSLTALGLSERTGSALEKRGVIWSGQLCEWTEAMLLLVPNFAAKTVHDIRFALAEVGLSLREPAEDEEAAIPPPVEQRPGNATAIIEQFRARQRRMVLALASGATMRAASAAGGVTGDSTGSAAHVRRTILDQLKRGESPDSVARYFRFRAGTAPFRDAVGYIQRLQVKYA